MELFIISSLVTRRFGRHNLDPSAICQLRRDNVFLSGWRLTVKIIKKFSIRFLSPVSSSQTNPLKKPFSWWYSIYALNVVKSLFWWMTLPPPLPSPFSILGVHWRSSGCLLSPIHRHFDLLSFEIKDCCWASKIFDYFSFFSIRCIASAALSNKFDFAIL